MIKRTMSELLQHILAYSMTSVTPSGMLVCCVQVPPPQPAAALHFGSVSSDAKFYFLPKQNLTIFLKIMPSAAAQATSVQYLHGCWAACCSGYIFQHVYLLLPSANDPSPFPVRIQTGLLPLVFHGFPVAEVCCCR